MIRRDATRTSWLSVGRRIGMFASAAVILTGMATGAWADTSRDNESATLPPELAERIDARFLAYQAEEHVPGIVWGIVKDGKLVHFRASGTADLETKAPVTEDSVFSIASMSKAFTALAILKLRDEGKLRLDALAEDYVPELRDWTYPTTDSPRIRVRDLLAHAGGLVTDNPWGDRQQDMPEEVFTEVLKQGVPFNTVPQTGYEYSNFGYALLGRIVTNASGMPYEEYIRTEILLPLGMVSTGYDAFALDQNRRALGYRWQDEVFTEQPAMEPGVFGAMGGMISNASDYEKWVAFLLDAWPARDGEESGPVKRSTVREMAQGLNFARVLTFKGLEEGDECDVAITYGMGFNVSTECELGTALAHSGGYPGYGSYVMLMPDAGVGIFTFANRTYAAAWQTVREAALEMKKDGWIEERAVPVSDVLAQAYALAGEIYTEGKLSPAEGQLAMNFLLDGSVAVRERALAELKEQVGACDTDAPIKASGRLSGTISWTCEKGDVEGLLLLSPTNPPKFQELRLRVAPAS
ncbi:serine hydrolase domain-containing protein [Hyphomonas pacifica]|nr:serine hydrolase domain-containing protein [Hyphomonas pacifica]